MLQPGAPRDRAARDLRARRRRPHPPDAHRGGACARPRRKSTRLCKEAGEQAVFDLGLHRVHPELVQAARAAQVPPVVRAERAAALGRGRLPRGADRRRARRERQARAPRRPAPRHRQGARSRAGGPARRGRRRVRAASTASRRRSRQAIASHHGDEGGGPQPSALLDHIVAAANSLSAARPGARREQLASYIKRLDDLEAICKRFAGVERAYALHGRPRDPRHGDERPDRRRARRS